MANGVTNLGEFEDFIDGLGDDLEGNGMEVVQKLGADLWDKVTKKTPVDTGRAHNSWNFNWGRPDPDVPPEGEQDLKSLPNPGTPILGGELHVSSNLSYIVYLEEGRPGPGSPQAPRGMAKISIQELEAKFD